MRAAHRAYLDIKGQAMTYGCSDCGTEWEQRLVRRGIPHSEWAAFFEADHVRGQKVAALSDLVRQKGSTVEALMAEAAKCEWVCIQCHRERTVMRRLSCG